MGITRIMYMEYKGDGIVGSARIGRVTVKNKGKRIEYGGQIFVPGGLRCLVDCHRYGPSICPPTLKCIETSKGQQGATPVLRLKCHYGHLRFLV